MHRIAAGALALAFGSSAGAVTVDVPSALDNLILEEVEDWASGKGEHVCAGRTNVPGTRRALFKFDLAAAGIPPGSTIASATLSLFMDNAASNANNGVFAVHRLTGAWGEGASDAVTGGCRGAAAELGDTTWRWRVYDPGNQPGSPQWDTLGTDYVAAASASSTLTSQVNQFKTWSSLGLVADVQLWVDDPASNHGWLLKRVNETGQGNAMRFVSRDHGTPSQHPKLTVVYTPPALFGACCLPGQSCQLASAAVCGDQGGVFQGAGSSCIPNLCPPDPTGACCGDGGSCSVLTEAACDGQDGSWQGSGVACGDVDCPLALTPFVDRLPIPQLAVPDSGTPGGSAAYTLAMREMRQRLHRDLPSTVVWGFGRPGTAATYPGPTIEARTNEAVSVTWVNDLRDLSQPGNPPPYRSDHYLDVDGLGPPPDCDIHGAEDEAKTVVHLHGAHVQAEFDGYPEARYGPGNQATYVYANRQRPSTLWYHDHALGLTRLNVYMGLAGVYLIRDAFEDALGLPSCPDPANGDTCYEIPLLMQDRTLEPDGRLAYPAAWQEQFFGNLMLVNGKVWPFHEVRQGKYRLRLLNGSGSRTLTLAFDRSDLPGAGDLPFALIGTEGGLIEAPLALDEITLAPAERADIVVDFSALAAGTTVLLANSAAAPYPGGGSTALPDVMRFVVLGVAGHTAPLPSELRPLETIDELEAIRSRELVLDRQSDACEAIWLIDDKTWDEISEYPQLGTTEIWRFVNPGNVMHPMHLHLVSFQILDRTPIGGGTPEPPGPDESGWKDTARAMPGMVTRVIARFEDYPGRFAYHCHVLEHEDHGMMRQFWAVEALELGFDEGSLTFDPQPGAASYDVVGGDLLALRASGGNFAWTAVTTGCIANDVGVPFVELVATPTAGNGFWYLVRANDVEGPSTYDSGSSTQLGQRDAEVLGSGNDCP